MIAPDGNPPSPAIDDGVAIWQGRIALAAKKGGGLDVLQAALEYAKENVPPNTGLLERVKSELLGTAERHLTEIHSSAVLDAIYLSVFSEEMQQIDVQNELDARAVEIDDRKATDGEIKRLARLNAIEYEHERDPAAKRLGMRVPILDSLVKKERSEAVNTLGQGRPLELPSIEPWPETVNGAELLSDICAALRHHLVLPTGCAEILALWVVHTHVFQCFAHSPRLAITSPEKGCGKTTTLDILNELVARPLPTSNATAAAIFRTIEKAEPTLLIDEADTFLRDNEELRGILNAGHRRGGQILRTVGEDHEPRQFSTWAPAAIAMIGRLPDTLEDRAVLISLRRKKPKERVHQFRSDRCDGLKVLARKIARLAVDSREALSAADPDTGTLANRVADNWRPLLAIADLICGEWPSLARTIAEAAETGKQDQSRRSMVLRDIRDFFAAHPGVDRVRSIELADALGKLENRPWSEWRNGKPMTPAALARLLGPFRISPGTKREGNSTFKGYLVSDFVEAFESYLPDETVTRSQANIHGLCEPSESVTREQAVTVSKVSQSNDDRLCDGVTVRADMEEEIWELE
jgi:putative DNA primase/helicase